MAIADLLHERFARADRLWLDLVEQLTPEQLGSRLATLPSNTIGGQLWCVLGARESYPRAARAREWQGFTSPVEPERTTDADAVRAALEQTAADVAAWLRELETDDDHRYALALLEHETQHHGQLIRYLYGLGIARPESWQRQYALDEPA
ncbi:DinB family protein [Agrococcus carbonis]|uniref:DinB family protein n=1 Tax=Agrococcus carbonis TaxID=684552 RepID=A0A1H1M6V5_9MICO|nr:hypothetical protein [Agrococcus carbonis]SDR82511.1 hypothetical protein SAMN04489719_0886 [Agrococcus carbonis]